ncbi:1-acylglycerol-3-phosphate O-acyltransferase [Kluyveromyces marxianus]|nr:1-acylglycerol-3-phosphate O-acyltransferase [Kluyveromyces marxianus]KAG0683798.1 1-acylglycerol-3-phosphate O-acyltransferase [Kluyveromyces marxianus]
MGFISKVVFWTKSVIAVTILSSCAIYGVLASIACIIIGKKHLTQWTTARCFYNAMSILMGIKVKLINGERLNDLPAIFISNHQSEMDILMLGRTFPPGCTVTAKKQLKWVPFLGWFMSLSGTLFLDRSNREKAIKVLNDSLATLKKEKRATWIFPEGTRSYSTKLEMKDFKKGAFHLAQQGKIQIVPVVVSNTSSIYHPRSRVFNRGTITVKVLEPINTDNLKKEDVPELCEKVFKMMNEELKKNVGYSEPIVDTVLPADVIAYNASKSLSQDGQEQETQPLEAAAHDVEETADDQESIHSAETDATNPEPTERTSLLKA